MAWRQEAGYAAARQIGNLSRLQEEALDTIGFRFETALRDFRHRRPGGSLRHGMLGAGVARGARGPRHHPAGQVVGGAGNPVEAATSYFLTVSFLTVSFSTRSSRTR